MKTILRSLLALVLFAPLAGQAQTRSLGDALREASARHAITLVEFRAPWCYSCYYMAQHVHTGPEWAALQRRVVFLEMDADSPEGAEQMKARNVKALPAYLAFDDQGREIGRILGEQRREDFYRQINTFSGARAAMEDLRASAQKGGAPGRRAALAALAAFHARADAGAGIAWFYDLPGPLRGTYEADPGIVRRLARLRLMQAGQAGDAQACTAVADEVFASDLGCERPYELERYRRCAAPDGSDALLRSQLEPMRRLVATQVFGKGPACADERSAVLGLADLHATLGNADERSALLDRAIALAARRTGKDPARDRNAADNLRLYLETRGDWPAYDALMPRLIAAWPDEYVYAFRFGRSLLERDRAREALPFLERAAAQAYGQNRLKVAEIHVRALKRLGRGDDARQVAADALRANGPWFPELAASLKAQP